MGTISVLTGRANGAGPQNMERGCENGSKHRRVKSDASPEKLSVKDTILIFTCPAFTAKGCVNYAKLDTILLWRKTDVYYSRNPPRNAEDNPHAEHVVIEDWFRGYCVSPGLEGPRASDLLMWAGLMGRQDTRSKILSHIRWGLSHAWMASICVRICYSYL